MIDALVTAAIAQVVRMAARGDRRSMASSWRSTTDTTWPTRDQDELHATAPTTR